MVPPVDTKNAAAVAAFAQETFARVFPQTQSRWLGTLYRDIEVYFSGKHPAYSAIDLGYHDFEHTLQASACLAWLLEGAHRAKVDVGLTPERFELAMAGALLHDAGYLKLRTDTEGTGAKYTFCHVLRSCAFAASYLPTIGIAEAELSGVLGAINCTGPTKQISRLHFRDSGERFIGCALATADFLGQMAAPDYPDELEILFREFNESDDFIHVPKARRVFRSAEDLIARTPDFWRKFVRPKLEADFQGVYQYLTVDGVNPYIDAIERNIAIIEKRIAASQKKPAATVQR